YNTEFFVDLLPRSSWRRQFKTKEELIAAMDKALTQIPGVDWNFSQPISDNVEEAVSGVKGELAVKLFGRDLKVLEQKAEEISVIMTKILGVANLATFQVRAAQCKSGCGSCGCGSLRHERERLPGRD